MLFAGGGACGCAAGVMRDTHSVGRVFFFSVFIFFVGPKYACFRFFLFHSGAHFARSHH